MTIHDIWCCPTATQPWAPQIMVADTQDDQWQFRRTPTINRALATLGGSTTDGIPYLAPEIQLLYKAKGPRQKDEADFARALPALSQERRHWLENSLATVHPHHPWLTQLTASYGVLRR